LLRASEKQDWADEAEAAIRAGGTMLAAFAVTAAYVPWFADAAGAPRWVLLSLLTAACVRVPALRPGHIVGALFLGWAALSIAWTPVTVEALQPWWHFAVLGALFCIAYEMESLEPVFVGAAWGMTLSGVVALGQMLIGGEPAGLFFNKNFMAEAAVLVLIGLAVYRHFVMALLVLPAAVLPLARGALLALGVVIVLALWRHKHRWAALAAVGLTAAVLLLAVGLNGKSLGERGVIWGLTLQHPTLLGHGLGAFYIDFPSFADLARRFNHAHNDWLEIAYELGVIGVLLLGLLFAGAMRHAGGGIRYVVAGFIVEGCFAFPLFLPITAALATLCLGHLWGLRDRLQRVEHDGERALRHGARQFGLPRRVMALAPRRGDLPA